MEKARQHAAVMGRGGWHILRDVDTVTVARGLPVRFDLRASAAFPTVARLRLAHQVRQDLWRMLRDLKGFRPVVRISTDADGLCITAGGDVSGPIPKTQSEARIFALLHDPRARARWLAHARKATP